MGLDVKLVQSDETHYMTFICNICHKVADLDAMVTSKCSHAFCKGCLESWLPKSPNCPTCTTPIVGIKYGDAIPCQTCRQQESEIYPLAESQPLAYESLSKIQVSCPHCQNWEGDYRNFAQHQETCKYRQFNNSSRKASRRGSRRASLTESPHLTISDTSPSRSRSPRRSTMDHSPTNVSMTKERLQDRYPPGVDDSNMFGDIDQDLGNDMYEPLNSSSMSNRRIPGSGSERDSPLSRSEFDESGGSGSSRHRSTLGNRSGTDVLQHETIPEDSIPYGTGNSSAASSATASNNNVDYSSASTTRPDDFESTLHSTASVRRPRSRTGRSPARASTRDDSAENRASPVRKMRSSSTDDLMDYDDLGDSLGGSGSGTAGSSGNNNNNNNKRSKKQRSRDVATANVLKEKANARFNKGDLAEAKLLYTQALNIFPDYKGVSPEDKQVIATLFCNRGATSFREKDHEGCIQDCESAIQLYPEYAKAYTRKWRALVALGRVQSAKSLLESAIQKMPREKALQDDLHKTRQILDAQASVKRLYLKRNYVGAKDAVDNQLLVLTENPEALLLAAEVDASNGLMETGLERCETVLKANPKNVKALQVKGYITFLTGLMDSGIKLVNEATDLDPDDSESADVLDRCRTIHKEYMDGRSVAATGRSESSKPQLKNAVDAFSAILEDESGFVPPKTPLYSLFLTERAEASLYAQFYQSALADSRAAIETKEDNLRAWVVKAHAFIALGRAKEARDELKLARRTAWGKNNDQLREVYSKADFEARVNEADQELRTMVAESRGGRSPGEEMITSSTHEMTRSSSHRPRRRGSDVSLGTANTAGSNRSSRSSSRPRRRKSLSGIDHERAEARRRASSNTATLLVQQDRQEMLGEIRRQSEARNNKSAAGQVTNPTSRGDIMREIRKAGPALVQSKGKKVTKNRDDVLKAIRTRNKMDDAPRSSRKLRHRRRHSAVGSAPSESPDSVDPKSQPRQQRKNRPMMSEADIRRRMSAI